MKLGGLIALSEADFKGIFEDTEIYDLSFDSRKVKNGDLFFALKGSDKNGAEFVSDAFDMGAVAVVTDKPDVFQAIHSAILVSDVRATMALVSARFYSEAHKKVNLIGVVGTNGKTSVTYILEAILKAASKKVMVIGTLGIEMDGIVTATDMTTPDPIVLHKMIFEAWKNGVEYVVMEISAHAIYWKKTFGMFFESLIFTNFSEDHLDFFKTMEQYKEIKKSIFTVENARFAVVNADDAVGNEILQENKIPCVSYGIDNPSDVFPVDISTENGIYFLANLFDELITVVSKLYGYFNVYNLLAALTSVRVLKVPAETAAIAIKTLPPIPGRFNLYKKRKTAVVDYAHTPDGLANVLSAAREMTNGKLICVFGCGGNRDALKRPMMGEIAGKLADFTVITSDNPRLENPEEIMDGIECGIEPVTDNYVRIRDRKKAVIYALGYASEKDIVLIAGKGEENYIDENGKKTFYMDKLVVEDALRRF